MLGELVDFSQYLTDVRLKNLVPETRALPQMARHLGAYAASAFGAGFGGSCWAVVEKDRADAFADEWKALYLEAFPHVAKKCLFFTMPPGPGAFRLGRQEGMFAMQ